MTPARPRRHLATLVSLAAAALLATLLGAAGGPAVAAPGAAPAAASDDEPETGPAGYFSSFAASRPVRWRPTDGTDQLYVEGGSGFGAPGPLVVGADAPVVPGALSPPSWSGDLSLAVGGAVRLTARLLDSAATPAFDLELRSTDGEVLHASTPNPNADGSLPYITDLDPVPLRAGAWTTDAGTPATEADLVRVLGSLDALEVSSPVVDPTQRPSFYLYAISLFGPADVGLSQVFVIERQGHHVRGYVPAEKPCGSGRTVELLRQRDDGEARVVATSRVGPLERFRFDRRTLRPGRYAYRLGEDTIDGVTCTAATSRTFTVRR